MIRASLIPTIVASLFATTLMPTRTDADTPSGQASPAPPTGPVKEQVKKVLDELERLKKAAADVPEVPFPFGHFMATDQTAAPVLNIQVPTQRPADSTPQPQVTIRIKGIIAMGDTPQVITDRGTFSVGDTIPNYGKILSATETSVQIQRLDGKTETKDVE